MYNSPILKGIILENILQEYDKNSSLYDNFKNKMQVLLKELLYQQVEYHNVSSRFKDRDSLIKKIKRKDKYKQINEITDIVGCRIITYFEDDVDSIVKIISKEFNIDVKNSTNKINDLESEKFGYLSHHIVCSINSNRSSLLEYQRYKDIKFEIQVRSILQHAWAEIEHDIGYKSLSGIPKEIRRKFSRVAGLLETADENFCDIKKQINKYNEKINKNEKSLLNTDINIDSLYAYTIKSKIVDYTDNCIIPVNSFLEKEVKKDSLNDKVKKLFYFNINTISELDNLITQYSEEIIKFASSFLSKYNELVDNDNDSSWQRGITYFYLAYFLAVKDKNIEKLKSYLYDFNIISDDVDNEDDETDISNDKFIEILISSV